MTEQTGSVRLVLLAVCQDCESAGRGWPDCIKSHRQSIQPHHKSFAHWICARGNLQASTQSGAGRFHKRCGDFVGAMRRNMQQRDRAAMGVFKTCPAK